MKQTATVFLVAVMALIAAACGVPEPTQTPTPTATPMPTATPWTLSSQEAAAIAEGVNSVIDIARTRMAALRTAHYSIDAEGQGSKLELDVRIPYEVRGVITGSGDLEEVGLLLTKGKAFTGDPNGSCWSERSTPFAIVAVHGLNVVSPILQAQLDLTDSILNLEHVTDETDEAFYHVRFDIDWPLWFTLWMQGLDQATGEETANAMYPPESREAMLSGGIQGTAYEGEVWIDKETLRVHRFLWEQVSTLTGLPRYTWDVTVSRFDQAVPEVPDLEAIASVGPCTEDSRPGATTTPTPAPTASPTPSATGALGDITFRSFVDGNADIYVVNDDGSNQTRLTDSQGFDDMPVWSPDGSKIAFVSVIDSISDIYVINPDGSNQTQLAVVGAIGKQVDWSPDGSKIAFYSGSEGEIFVMDVDGSNPTQLTNIPGLSLTCCPAWSPAR